MLTKNHSFKGTIIAQILMHTYIARARISVRIKTNTSDHIGHHTTDHIGTDQFKGKN